MKAAVVLPLAALGALLIAVMAGLGVGEPARTDLNSYAIDADRRSIESHIAIGVAS